MKTRKSDNKIKVLHSGEVFKSCENFPPGVLPTRRQVLERIIHFKNFRTVHTANDVAQEIFDRWVFCNVYPLHLLTISKKLQNLVTSFSILDRWSKKKRGKAFLAKEAELLSNVDELFDVFCDDVDQRRRLEREHKLRMTDEDFSFYADQKGRRAEKCLDVVIPLTSSDQMFIRRSETQLNAPCQSTSMVTAPNFEIVSESESTSSQSSDASKLFVKSNLCAGSMQNRRKWPSLARMSERYQLSDRAAAAIANSVLVDVGLVTDDDRSYVIDRSKLRRERDRCREDIREKEQHNFEYVNALYFGGRKDATQMVAQGPNNKHYRSVQLEEHYTVVGEPGAYYLTHVSPEDGKGRTIAKKTL